MMQETNGATVMQCTLKRSVRLGSRAYGHAPHYKEVHRVPYKTLKNTAALDALHEGQRKDPILNPICLAIYPHPLMFPGVRKFEE